VRIALGVVAGVAVDRGVDGDDASVPGAGSEPAGLIRPAAREPEQAEGDGQPRTTAQRRREMRAHPKASW
jgi:hypothetical protein